LDGVLDGRVLGRVLGRADGRDDGRREGLELGALDGILDGRLLGRELGRDDGRLDGLALGRTDGRALGRTDGRALGRTDGREDGMELREGRLTGSSTGIATVGVGRATGSSLGTFTGLGLGKKRFKKKSSATVPSVEALVLVGNISIGSAVGVAAGVGVGTRSAVGGASSSSACNVTILFSVNCSDATSDGGGVFESESKVLSILLSISVASEAPLPATSAPLAVSSNHCNNSRSNPCFRSSFIFSGEDLVLLHPVVEMANSKRRSWYHRSFVRLWQRYVSITCTHRQSSDQATCLAIVGGNAMPTS
jgi:hypothetical protein